MTVKIPLRLRGFDLRVDAEWERIHPDLTELLWTAAGGVSRAVVYNEEPPSVAMDQAIRWAWLIADLMPGVEVAGVDDELVSISDIARRAAVGAEAVRLWTTGKRRAGIRPFPAPRQVAGGGAGGKSMALYSWREVVSWIRDVIGIDPDEGIDYLTDAQLASLNLELTAIAAAPDSHHFQMEWDRHISDLPLATAACQ
jgi:hypothetical protein